MWTSHILLGILGLIAGTAASAGTFAFIIIVGVIPRVVGKCKRAANTLIFENAVILGGIIGNLLSVFLDIRIPLGTLLLCVYGVCAGIFVGCIAVALAEILNTFPIMFRRFHLKMGLAWVMVMMALGKMCGSFYYFFTSMKETGM